MPDFAAANQRTSVTDIDESQLEKEWVNQPSKYREYADKLAAARKKLADRKAELDVVEADLKQRIRKQPQKFGIDKVTEGAINEVVTLNKEYQNALSSVNDAKYLVDLYDGTTTALEHRKKALESLVFLWGQGYFAEPKVRKGTEEAVQAKLDHEKKKAVYTKRRVKKD